MESDSALKSIAMLKDVVAGKTYDAVAAEHGVTRTAVERRIKGLALKLSREVGIDGLNQDGLAFVQRLRTCSASVLSALERYTPAASQDAPPGRILTDQEIDMAVRRTRSRSACPRRDTALFYMLLSTGARPLEIARVEVRDYLCIDGSVREESVLRADVAINRSARPLFFASQRANAAIDDYLAERLRHGLGTTAAGTGPAPASYRGLDPHSRLFLTEAGAPFEIVSYGEVGQTRFLCRGILETYRKIFRRIGLEGMSALNARRTVAARLLERGAAEDQIGVVLGISELKSVRELLPHTRQPLHMVVRELV
ncbi:site-specific integrase [Undibacterium sp. Jales W-56]|uniref:site-specific integrase n=1 Tax=Undibacterium sp. Jales W-56 TaxID=2897325 RepID=UPI0021D29985|nr:site-specific integrase [Undibacterium sp. Jales W-56]MCU6435309.1 site-specific integrase [Undibacterium sp. Jales W-56]